MLNSGEPGSLNIEHLQEFSNKAAIRGLRVLAFARCVCKANKQTIAHDDVSEGMTFLGIQAMMTRLAPKPLQLLKPVKWLG